MTTVAVPSGGTELSADTKPTAANLVEQAWIWSVVGYTVLRFVVAWGAFSEHGANVWIFGLLDVGTAWPYAKAIALVCRRAANSEWRRLPGPILVAIVSFFAPYVYLWFAAGSMPAGVRLAMVLFVSVLLVAATVGVLSKTRKLRRAGALDTAAPVVADELIIDLRVPEPRGKSTHTSG